MKKLLIILFIGSFFALTFAFSPSNANAEQRSEITTILEDTTKTKKADATKTKCATKKSCCKSKCSDKKK